MAEIDGLRKAMTQSPTAAESQFAMDSRGIDAMTLYETRFIGEGGPVLAEIPGLTPRCSFKGNEHYVRARIADLDGRVAWIQPVFLAHGKPIAPCELRGSASGHHGTPAWIESLRSKSRKPYATFYPR